MNSKNYVLLGMWEIESITGVQWNREIPTLGCTVPVGNSAKPRFPLERWTLGLGFPCPHWTPVMDSLFLTYLCWKDRKIHEFVDLCKLYLALLARLLVQDKKSTRHNSNVSSQISCSMVLQAKGSSHATTAESLNSRLLNVLNWGKIKLLSSLSLETF